MARVWSQSASRKQYGLRAVDERCRRIGGGGGFRIGFRESVHVPLTGHYVTWTQQHCNGRSNIVMDTTRVHVTNSLNQTTGVSDTHFGYVLDTHGSMIEVSVLYRLDTCRDPNAG